MLLSTSVADPDPPDPHVFGSPGSGSFYHHAKIVRIPLIPTILWLFLTFNLWKMMQLYLQKVISRKNCLGFLLASWRSTTKIAGSGSEFGSGSISQRHGSADPDPHQNVMDPQHCFLLFEVLLLKDILIFLAAGGAEPWLTTLPAN
jgi:hypothetical protein